MTCSLFGMANPSFGCRGKVAWKIAVEISRSMCSIFCVSSVGCEVFWYVDFMVSDSLGSLPLSSTIGGGLSGWELPFPDSTTVYVHGILRYLVAWFPRGGGGGLGASVAVLTFSGKRRSRYRSSGHGGVRSMFTVCGSGAILGCLARIDSHCPHNFGVCVDCQVRESSCSVADDGSSGFVSLMGAIVTLVGLLPDVSASLVWGEV